MLLDILASDINLALLLCVAGPFLASVFIYRLFLHPLASIPGPRLAALTSLYEAYYDVFKPGQYVFKIAQLHYKYGPILRISPNELHISDPEFLGQLYDSRKRNKPPENSLSIEQSVAGTVHYELHRRRRQAMVSYFTPKAVHELEPLLVKKRDALVSMLEKSAEMARSSSEGKRVVNLSDLYFGYTWDVINEYAFAFESNISTNLAKANELRNGFSQVFQTVHFSKHFGWVNRLIELLPSFVRSRLTQPGVSGMIVLAKKVKELTFQRQNQRVLENVQDVLTDLNAKTQHSEPPISLNDSKDQEQESDRPQHHKSIFYTLCSPSAELPHEEKQPDRLQSEGVFLVLAGTESPARTLSVAHFHLLSNPETLQKLRAELHDIPLDASLSDLENLPYLNAVLEEANRISFGVTRRSVRLAPEESLHYGNFKIPPNTAVSISTLSVLGNESVYPDPLKFKPERWLGSNAARLRRYNIAFGAKGPRSCLGVHLAMAEMRLALSRTVRFELELFETDGRDVSFEHDYQIAFGRMGSLGVRAQVLG